MARNGGKMAKHKICVLFKFPDFNLIILFTESKSQFWNDGSKFSHCFPPIKLIVIAWLVKMHDSWFRNWLLDPVSKIDSTNLFEPNIGDENLSFHVHTNNLWQFKTHFDGEPIGAVSNWPNEPEKKNNIIWNEDNLFDSTYVFGIQV